jgi:hypothetical protein
MESCFSESKRRIDLDPVPQIPLPGRPVARFTFSMYRLGEVSDSLECDHLMSEEV